MAKGANDVILRDRLQFDVNVSGDTALVYGRVDMSDYVSIVENKGLAVKEVRFQLRTRDDNDDGVFPNVLTDTDLNAIPSGPAAISGQVKIFATTTAYENIVDVGIGSPNVLCVFEKQTTLGAVPGVGAYIDTYEHMFGTPDLHPEGFDIVTDLLIGIGLEACSNPALTETTCELDVMVIAEPKKITQKDLTQMLSQAQDL